jgi:hypothetical protein
LRVGFRFDLIWWAIGANVHRKNLLGMFRIAKKDAPPGPDDTWKYQCTDLYAKFWTLPSALFSSSSDEAKNTTAYFLLAADIAAPTSRQHHVCEMLSDEIYGPYIAGYLFEGRIP